MNNPFKNFFDIVTKSWKKDSGISSTRLTSFIITTLIVLFCMYFLFMAIWIGINLTGSIPNEIIIVFGALLTHQLTLLGINKHNETKQKIEISKNIQEKEIEETKEISNDSNCDNLTSNPPTPPSSPPTA